MDIEKELSKSLDQILEERPTAECNAIGDEDRAVLEFAERLAKSKPFPRSSFQAQLRRRLTVRAETAMPAGESWWGRLTASLVSRGPRWRPALAGVLIVLLLGGIFLALSPGTRTALYQARLRETAQPSPGSPEPEAYVSVVCRMGLEGLTLHFDWQDQHIPCDF
ncbi:MAG: hypothetical protein ISS50_00200 [Anaerolineae bacterium]|nr:hypothetical protein [Anaerolineae bacterium]